VTRAEGPAEFCFQKGQQDQLRDPTKDCCGLSKKPCCLSSSWRRESFASHPASSTRIACSISPHKFLNFLLNLIWIPGETDGSNHVLQSFAFRILHLVKFFHVRQVGRSLAGDFLSLLQHLSRSLATVLKRASERVSARCQTPLVQRHQDERFGRSGAIRDQARVMIA
jgi:hypothetical protein